jgi:hypothetical protein
MGIGVGGQDPIKVLVGPGGFLGSSYQPEELDNIVSH